MKPGESPKLESPKLFSTDRNNIESTNEDVNLSKFSNEEQYAACTILARNFTGDFIDERVSGKTLYTLEDIEGEKLRFGKYLLEHATLDYQGTIKSIDKVVEFKTTLEGTSFANLQIQVCKAHLTHLTHL